MRLRGDLDYRKTGRVRKKLSRALARGPGTLEVDLSKVTYLAPECGTVLLTAARDARLAGTRFVITRGTRQSLGVLRKLGLERFFDVALPPDQ
ncbi:STAS domain-containing protein [Streptomyces sp. NPDC091385]|uniref:STAS domain-containing protein n=1 Tax=Streptomyces sp. NPDC091385 TaxID=3365997 RepID=UPI003825A3D5